jgi:integrase
VTFSKQADIYIAKLKNRRRKKVKKTTIATLSSVIQLATAQLGKMPLEAIENEDLKLLVDRLVSEGYASNTVRLALRAAKEVIASAVDGRGNPLISKVWNDDHIDQPRAENLAQTELLTAAQIEEALRNARPIIREFIAFQASTGLRKGEILALNVQDFDYDARTIQVSRTISYHGETAPKTRSGVRIVDLHPDIADMLNAMLSGRTTGRLFEVMRRSGLPGTAEDKVRWSFERLGLKTHALRHFRYTHLQMSSVPNAIRDFWIGHSQSGMEAIYGHISKNAQLRRKLAAEIGIGFILPSAVVPEVAQPPAVIVEETQPELAAQLSA